MKKEVERYTCDLCGYSRDEDEEGRSFYELLFDTLICAECDTRKPESDLKEV